MEENPYKAPREPSAATGIDWEGIALVLAEAITVLPGFFAAVAIGKKNLSTTGNALACWAFVFGLLALWETHYLKRRRKRQNPFA
jgi:uncharacterized membrane protein YdjX (TVP38/TMEM64 family)